MLPKSTKGKALSDMISNLRKMEGNAAADRKRAKAKCPECEGKDPSECQCPDDPMSDEKAAPSVPMTAVN